MALNPYFASFLKQGVNMKKSILLSLIIIMGCEDAKQELVEKNQLVFVASEGNYGSSNGSISVFRDGEKIQQFENIGDVLQSIVVHNDKLIVALNNSHFLKFYEITINGLLLPGIEISTDNSSPREMIVLNNKLYFTNWNTKDVTVIHCWCGVSRSMATATYLLCKGNLNNIDRNVQYIRSIAPHANPNKLLINLFEKYLNLKNEISKAYQKYPYTKVYDCSSNFAPITLFNIEEMKVFK